MADTKASDAKPAKLTASDRTFLSQREKIVTQGHTTATQVALAVHEIREYKDGILWKSRFTKFEHYIASRWKFHRSHVSRLIRFGEFVNDLKGHNQNCLQLETIPEPERESHVRPFLKLPQPLRLESWNAYLKATPAKPNAKTATAFCDRLFKINGLSAEAPVDPAQMQRLRLALEECRQALNGVNQSAFYLPARMRSVERMLLEEPNALVFKGTQLAAASKALSDIKAQMPVQKVRVRVHDLLSELDELLHVDPLNPWKPRKGPTMAAFSELKAAIDPISRRCQLLDHIEEIDGILAGEGRAIQKEDEATNTSEGQT